MKNKLGDLNDHLFAQLERMAEEGITAEQLEQEAREATRRQDEKRGHNAP